jgi:hypothetical protein
MVILLLLKPYKEMIIFQYLTLIGRFFGPASTRRAAGTVGTRQYGTVKLYISSMLKLTIYTRVLLIDGQKVSTTRYQVRYTEYRYVSWSTAPDPY